MYGKLFSSMYDGTLYGQWQGIITLQQLVILADADGVVDMTPPAIAARTSIPLDIIEAGLDQLSQSDKYSRTPTEDGRRIVLLDDDRPWGWRIVNYKYYRDLASREDKKEKDRQRIAEKRNKNNNVAECRNLSQSVADVAHTDTYTDKKNTTAVSRPRHEYPDEFESVWTAYPNRLGGNPKNRAFKAWNARRSEGHTPEEIAEGVERYARFCNATNKTGTELVKQAATFFGPDKGFLETWQTAPKVTRGFVG
jgi:hypothetical protein